MKVNGFFKDVTGASRVTKARRKLIESGSSANTYSDHIREIAQEVHPKVTHVRVTKVEEVSPTARKFHTCSQRCVFGQVHALTENDSDSICRICGKLCEAFSFLRKEWISEF